jgi:hypothetical protein
MENLDFIEYTDVNDNYVHPIQQIANDVVPYRVYCHYKGCMKYIKGALGYNGAFIAETGQFADLRNKMFICTEHENL